MILRSALMFIAAATFTTVVQAAEPA